MGEQSAINNELILLKDDANQVQWDVEVDVLIIGCGGCGLMAGLAAAQQGAQVLIVEKENSAGGNTSLSQGMFPAAGSKFQKMAGVDDSPEVMAQDILTKNKNESDPEMTLHIARQSGRLIDWLWESEGIKLELVTNFLYPGHTRHRIHAPKTTKGTWLVNKLLEAAKRHENLDIAYAAPARRLIARSSDMAVLGAEVDISGVGLNLAGAKKTILALNGFGANRAMVARYILEMADAYYFGHEGNTGEGILWGEALGGRLVNMGAYQAHGSVAHPHGTLLSWAAISLGGYQVNSDGVRFVNENHGYSEHALDVLAQKGQTAVEIFDHRIFQELEGFEDFQKCLEMGAIKKFESIEELAKGFGIDPEALAAEHERFQECARGEIEDRLGRQGLDRPLQPPYYGVRVTGALFHTQGGLQVDKQARVLNTDGKPIENLYAGGGCAVGLSGTGVAGYLSANGLLAALTLGMLSGEDAAREVV
jgi:fumarate reductase flavoprotein subunit